MYMIYSAEWNSTNADSEAVSNNNGSCVLDYDNPSTLISTYSGAQAIFPISCIHCNPSLPSVSKLSESDTRVSSDSQGTLCNGK